MRCAVVDVIETLITQIGHHCRRVAVLMECHLVYYHSIVSVAIVLTDLHVRVTATLPHAAVQRSCVEHQIATYVPHSTNAQMSHPR